MVDGGKSVLHIAIADFHHIPWILKNKPNIFKLIYCFVFHLIRLEISEIVFFTNDVQFFSSRGALDVTVIVGGKFLKEMVGPLF